MKLLKPILDFLIKYNDWIIPLISSIAPYLLLIFDYLRQNIPFCISLFCISLMIFIIVRLFIRNREKSKIIRSYNEFSDNFSITLQDGTVISSGYKFITLKTKYMQVVPISFNKSTNMIKYINRDGAEYIGHKNAFQQYR